MRVPVLAVLAALALPAAAQTPAAAPPATPSSPPAASTAAPATTASPAPATPAFSPEQRREIVGILREALRADPSILGEALRANPLVLRGAFEALQALEAQDREAVVRAAIADNRDALFRDPADPVRGNPEGAVTLVEFFDVRCPYCKQLNIAMGDLVRRNPDVRVVLKDLPVLGPNSLLAARALIAAQRQDKYRPLHDALMKLREDPVETVIRREAEKLGIDWARLRRDMDDPATARRVAENRRLAEALRLEGTPAVVVGDTLLPGAVDLATLERLVAEERAKARRGG
jgi:protein-disulfide isomerase